MANAIEVKGIEINYRKVNDDDYISLTDIARYKNPEHPADIVNKWMTNKDSFDFYSLWEELYNPNFNFAECREIKINELGYNAFTMSPSQWSKRTNAIGIKPSAGRYSKGTLAHPDIAFEFASWIDATFKLYLIKEFQRLKQEEAKQLEWDAKRELAKINYTIHTYAIKENLILPELTKSQISYTYASEADVLNVALFGMTAGEWKADNKSKKGNMRDYASLTQLLVLANMESYNALLIEQGIAQSERLVSLNKMAITQIKTLQKSNSWLLKEKE